MFKNKILFWVIIMLFLFSGCSSISVEDNSFETYSREDTRYMCESDSFGKGRSDDIYVALEYIYSDETIQEKHGSDFNITSNDIVCHLSEGDSYFFKGLYKGRAEYSFTIDDVIYRVNLSKGLFGVWTVTDCYSE